MSRKAGAMDLAKALGRQNVERAAAAQPAAPSYAAAMPVAPQAVPAVPFLEARPAGPGRAPSRAGQTNISGWFDMPVKLKLDELRIARQRALGRRVTQQELLSEAFNDLFKKYGLPEMAPSGTGR